MAFQHAEIYDVDGSFAEAVESWVQANGHGAATLTYHRAWPGRLSETLRGISERHPYCAEAFAYAHCLTTHRALSRWVALLHAPDEYLVIRQNPTQGALLEVLEGLEATLPQVYFSFVQVNAVSFARGGPGSESELVDPRRRGSVLAGSRLRTPGPYFHMPLVDPVNCLSSGPHACYAEAGRQGASGVTMEVRPGLLLVHHYVEMMSHNAGRCTMFNLNMPCVVPDSSADWVVEYLRSS